MQLSVTTVCAHPASRPLSLSSVWMGLDGRPHVVPAPGHIRPQRRLARSYICQVHIACLARLRHVVNAAASQSQSSPTFVIDPSRRRRRRSGRGIVDSNRSLTSTPARRGMDAVVHSSPKQPAVNLQKTCCAWVREIWGVVLDQEGLLLGCNATLQGEGGNSNSNGLGERLANGDKNNGLPLLAISRRDQCTTRLSMAP